MREETDEESTDAFWEFRTWSERAPRGSGYKNRKARLFERLTRKLSASPDPFLPPPAADPRGSQCPSARFPISRRGFLALQLERLAASSEAKTTTTTTTKTSLVETSTFLRLYPREITGNPGFPRKLSSMALAHPFPSPSPLPVSRFLCPFHPRVVFFRPAPSRLLSHPPSSFDSAAFPLDVNCREQLLRNSGISIPAPVQLVFLNDAESEANDL